MTVAASSKEPPTHQSELAGSAISSLGQPGSLGGQLVYKANLANVANVANLANLANIARKNIATASPATGSLIQLGSLGGVGQRLASDRKPI